MEYANEDRSDAEKVICLENVHIRLVCAILMVSWKVMQVGWEDFFFSNGLEKAINKWSVYVAGVIHFEALDLVLET